MDRGSKFYEPTGETTEWEDILIKKGILAPKTKVQEEEEESEDEQYDARQDATIDELDEMEQLSDDNDTSPNAFSLLRTHDISERRIAEMKAQAARNKFGEIQPISKDEWTREVTEGSQENWVIAYLWDDALEECKLMDSVLRAVAKNHRDVKFVSIQAQACIENWPQRNCPTLFMYHKGDLKNQVLGIRKLGGLDMKVEDLEERLAEAGVFKTDN
ncbi:Phosducin-like protein, partial [Globisporangium splendens]